MTLAMRECPGACVAFWSGTPTVRDCDDSVRAAKRAFAANNKAPLALVGVMMPDASMPCDVVRRRLAAQCAELVPLASSIQYVCLRPDFVGATLMSIAASYYMKLTRSFKVGTTRDLSVAIEAIRVAGGPSLAVEKLIVDHIAAGEVP